eukprot:CAMPEP_0179375980 /NCGR_PEP_ID=MMETSP0797-20121207/88081_1 /TAXON_ID=47934 /ORGANISM="Dinophysis acuminata, Strain DAEP01" /LENGTH=114 /DNA_ID=CAMNT_0021092001 /DNA_START=309 /DNA_END=653 /DNA_ORIENTATION=+
MAAPWQACLLQNHIFGRDRPASLTQAHGVRRRRLEGMEGNLPGHTRTWVFPAVRISDQAEVIDMVDVQRVQAVLHEQVFAQLARTRALVLSSQEHLHCSPGKDLNGTIEAKAVR